MPVFPKYTVPFFVHFRESRMEIVFESLPLMSNSWQNIAGETFFFFRVGRSQCNSIDIIEF